MIIKTNSSLEQISNLIKGNKSFSIYIHVHTDIDAIGSSLALKRALEQMGKIAHVFVDSEFPNNSYVFEDIDKINNEKLSNYDVAIVLDSNNEERIGRLRYKYRKNVKTTLQIDHHLENPMFCKYNYVDTNVSSTCENVYKLLKHLNIKFDQEICRLLISGIYTDTGCLKFSNTYPSTFTVLAELQELGRFYMDEISMPIFNSLTEESFNLKKLAYNKVELFEEGKVVFITILAKDLKELNVKFSETKGLTDIGMQMAKAKIVVLFTEGGQEPGVYYLSFRTKEKYSAKAIAEVFGGGGHLKASGCKIVDTLENAKDRVLEAVRKELKNVGVR